MRDRRGGLPFSGGGTIIIVVVRLFSLRAATSSGRRSLVIEGRLQAVALLVLRSGHPHQAFVGPAIPRSGLVPTPCISQRSRGPLRLNSSKYRGAGLNFSTSAYAS